MERKLGDFEAISSLMMISIADIVLTSARVLIKTCDSASLINSVVISIVAIIFTFTICTLSKHFIGQNLLDIAEFLGGKFFKIILGFGFIFYYTLLLTLLVKQTSDAMQIIYYPLTHIIFIIALLCISAGIIAFLGNESIFKATSLVLPFIYFAIFLIFIGNVKNFKLNNIFPLLGNGISQTFIVGLNNIFTFTGLSYLFFLPPILKKPERITKIGLVLTVFNSIYMIFCVANIFLLFNDAVNHSELPPLYIAVRYIEFGSFFQRLDAAFIFLCVLGLISALNINLYFILNILKQITNVSDSKPFIFPCLLSIFGAVLSLKQNSILIFLEDIFSKILFIIFAISIPFFIIVAGIIKKKFTEKKLNSKVT